MITYTFKEDAPLAFKNAKRANPQTIGRALEKIAKNADGHLSADAVWKAAQDPKHPLHKHYEWDVEKAAESHWRETSRKIIRVISVSTDSEPEPARAFISIAEKRGTSYRTVQDVRNSVDLQTSALNAAHRDLEAFEFRYREFQEICDVVRQARDLIAERKAKQKEGPRAPH